jgi:adenylate cyclase
LFFSDPSHVEVRSPLEIGLVQRCDRARETSRVSCKLACVVDISRTFDWLVDGAPGAKNAVEVIATIAPQMIDAGIPIDRIEAFVRTLHPHIVGRSFVWQPGKSVAVKENTYAYLQSPAFLDSPVAEVFRTGLALRKQGDAIHDELRQDGFIDFYAGPLRFMDGTNHAITFASRSGFTSEHLRAIDQVLRPLSRVGEILALTRTAANLLNTYVGHNAGERILAGHIQRGDTSSINAVLWFSDLRGFTSLSAELGPAGIIRVLNQLFDCQVPAIERHGGEVLKFIGDGLLAIFPLENKDPRVVCDAALTAADEAFASLDAINRDRSVPIQFGLALHIGEVAYGNIGGASRLDFTCIGPAVNLSARLEALTGKLNKRVVTSSELAKLTSRKLTSIGIFELKGVPGPVEAFAP